MYALTAPSRHRRAESADPKAPSRQRRAESVESMEPIREHQAESAEPRAPRREGRAPYVSAVSSCVVCNLGYNNEQERTNMDEAVSSSFITSSNVGIDGCQQGLQTASSTPEAQRHWREASIGTKPALARSQHWREASIDMSPALARSQQWREASIGMSSALARSQHWREASIGAKPASA